MGKECVTEGTKCFSHKHGKRQNVTRGRGGGGAPGRLSNFETDTRREGGNCPIRKKT